MTMPPPPPDRMHLQHRPVPPPPPGSPQTQMSGPGGAYGQTQQQPEQPAPGRMPLASGRLFTPIWLGLMIIGGGCWVIAMNVAVMDLDGDSQKDALFSSVMTGLGAGIAFTLIAILAFVMLFLRGVRSRAPCMRTVVEYRPIGGAGAGPDPSPYDGQAYGAPASGPYGAPPPNGPPGYPAQQGGPTHQGHLMPQGGPPPQSGPAPQGFGRQPDPYGGPQQGNRPPYGRY